jgi:hypothetical protein
LKEEAELYCRKCGAQIDDADVFCFKCGHQTGGAPQQAAGAAASPPPQPSGYYADAQPRAAQPPPPQSGGYYTGDQPSTAAYGSAVSIQNVSVFKLTSFVLPVVLVIILFLSWVSVPLLTTALQEYESYGIRISTSFSIPSLIIGLFRVVGVVSSIQEAGTFSAIAIILSLVLGGLMIYAIYAFASYIYNYARYKNLETDRLKKGLNTVVVLFALSFLGMLIINAVVSSESYGLVRETLALTFWAYAAGVIAIIARIFLPNMMEKEAVSGTSLLAIGVFVRNSTKDAEWYRIPLRNNQTLYVTIKPAMYNAGGMYMKLCTGGSRMTIASSGLVGTADTGTIQKEIYTTGDYFLAVCGDEGEYELSYTITSPEPAASASAGYNAQSQNQPGQEAPAVRIVPTAGGEVTCPTCHAVQLKNRSTCFRCGTTFIYDSETTV